MQSNHKKYKQDKNAIYLSKQDKVHLKKVETFFNKIGEKKRNRNLNNLIKNRAIKNNQVEYHPEYGFAQRWETDYKNRIEDAYLWIKQSSNLFFIINVISLLIRLGVLWYTTIRRIISFDDLDWMYNWLISLIVVQCVIKCVHLGFGRQKINDLKIDILGNAYSLIYSCLIITKSIDESVWMLSLDCLMVCICYNKCKTTYKLFHRILISSRFKNELNIVDLLFTLMKNGHIFTIMMYLVVYNSPNSNWTSKLDIPLVSWHDRYVYSMYFAYTTMLTVGYGDITPINKCQILVVLIVQVLGIVTVAYVINEIGNTLSQMRRKNQKIDHNLGMIERLCEYYQLNKQVIIKAKQYITNNLHHHHEVNIQEQTTLLNSLNDQLKESITNQTNSKLIKKSLFFICNWTKVFQNQIAKQLTKRIFYPNEKLYSTNSQQMYIIYKGTLNIFVEREHRGKVCLKKFIKSMNCNPSDQILRNVFGYSKALTNKAVGLVGQADKPVVAYTLDNNKFLNVVMQQTSDFQYYWQMKSKIDLMKVPQSYEVPQIIDHHQHYYHNIRKALYLESKSNHNQTRKRINRSSRRYDIILEEELKDMLLETINHRFNQQLNTTKTSNQQAKTHEQSFDREREYINYFKKYNINEILDKLANRNYSLRYK